MYRFSGDNLSGFYKITNGNIGVTGNLSANRLQATLCTAVGDLGYILLDEITTGAIPTANFTTFTANLDNQSTDTYAMYRLIFRGRYDGNGGIPVIEARFIDTIGDISDTGAYQRSLYDGDGNAISNTTATSFYFVRNNSSTSADFNWSGECTITLGSTDYENRIVGTHSMSNDTGSIADVFTMSANLTTSATLTTRVTAIGFQAANVNTGGSRDMQVRVFRLL